MRLRSKDYESDHGSTKGANCAKVKREATGRTSPCGRAMAGLLAIFAEFEREILRERVKAGIVQARQRGTRHGRPPTVAHCAEEVRHLYAVGLSKSAIARQLGISRTSVRRFLG